MLSRQSLRLFSKPQAFIFPPSHPYEARPQTSMILARRVIHCIRQRLFQYDPQRWNGVQISYCSHWLRPNGKVDIATCIQVHQALEKEFKVDILDQRVLITDVETACAIVSGEHLVQ